LKPAAGLRLKLNDWGRSERTQGDARADREERCTKNIFINCREPSETESTQTVKATKDRKRLIAPGVDAVN